MIYFDNAATGGAKPESVFAATQAALRACANPGRSGHALALACAERVQNVRAILRDFFRAPSSDRVIFTKNCTEALNVAILGALGAGDKIVATVAEHNSVLRPLEHLKSLGARVLYAPLDRSGNIDVRALASLAGDDASAIVITLASNVTGIAPDICAVRRAVGDRPLLICDGAQACGHIDIDMSSLGIDALAVAGHKGMMGVQGGGALIMSSRFSPSPVMFGGTGSASFSLDMPDFYPDALEAGTLNYPAIISMGEGALWLRPRLYENRDKLVYLTDLLINESRSYFDSFFATLSFFSGTELSTLRRRRLCLNSREKTTPLIGIHMNVHLLLAIDRTFAQRAIKCSVFSLLDSLACRKR